VPAFVAVDDAMAMRSITVMCHPFENAAQLGVNSHCNQWSVSAASEPMPQCGSTSGCSFTLPVPVRFDFHAAGLSEILGMRLLGWVSGSE
jgi:hypothetical protein